MSSLRFQATHKDGSDGTGELLSFAEAIGLEAVITGRYSVLLLLELFGGCKSGMQNPAKIVSQIRILEGVEANRGLKAATQFKHLPLQGLWHQHYFEDGLSSMAQNIRKGLVRFGLPWVEQKIADAKDSVEKKYFSIVDVPHIANDAINANWQRLRDAEALTGEWLIFAKHEGKNYYLSLGKHKGEHEMLRTQIEAIAVQEFPFLKDILSF